MLCITHIIVPKIIFLQVWDFPILGVVSEVVACNRPIQGTRALADCSTFGCTDSGEMGSSEPGGEPSGAFEHSQGHCRRHAQEQ